MATTTKSIYYNETREQLCASWKEARQRLINKSNGPGVLASAAFLNGLASETLSSKLSNLIVSV